MSVRFSLQILIIGLFSLLFSFQSMAESKRVLIFYSSIGMGHLSAARAIEKNLKFEDPAADVQLVNIRDSITPEAKGYVDEWLYWKVVKSFPKVYDYFFNRNMDQGNAADKLMTDTQYNSDDVLNVIRSFNPSHIITTHYGSTLALINLKEKKQLGNIPVAWLHTDYFQGYFPRISKNIDMTFLGLDALTDIWVKEGISPNKVKTTGIPINPKAFDQINREQVLTENQLDLNRKTIVLMSGGEGVGDFPLIVKSIASEVSEPIQIVAICGKNQRHFDDLMKLKQHLPANVRLQVHGFITDNDKVLNLIKASDIFITKSGGLSPTEGFAINRPIILLDVYGGHERKNSELLESQGLAVVNREQKEIGSDVKRLLTDSDLVERMLIAQKRFRNSFNMNAINEFVFSGKGSDSSRVLAVDFGKENGPKIQNTENALKAMDNDFNTDVEIILSYGKGDSHSIFKGDVNPFGHIAIKIDGTVYTLNGKAVMGVEKDLVWKTNLDQYLFGVERQTENMEHTDAFGSSYGRDNISIKISGVNRQTKDKMLAFVESIDGQFNQGKIKYSRNDFNCADLVKQILEAGGFVINGKVRKHTMPLDVITDYKNYFENQGEFETSVAIYKRSAESNNKFHQVTFPLSIYQLKRSLARILFKNRKDPLEKQVTQRIYVSTNGEAYYEKIPGKPVSSTSSSSVSIVGNSCLALYVNGAR